MSEASSNGRAGRGGRGAGGSRGAPTRAVVAHGESTAPEAARQTARTSARTATTAATVVTRAGVAGSAVILASAGTGKTHALTSRYIALLAGGAHAGQVLASTFTRKAAGEILARVLQRLARGATTQKGLDDLRAHADPTLTRERCATLLRGLAARLDRARVMTLDAFFAQAARSLGPDAGAPPAWEVSDDADDAAMRERALELALDDLEEPHALALLDTIANGLPSTPHARLMDVLGGAHAAYAECPEPAPWAWLEQECAGLGLSADALEDVLHTLAQSEALLPVTGSGRSARPQKPWSNALLGDIEGARLQDWPSMLTRGLMKPLLRGDSEFSGKPIPAALSEAYAPLVRHARAMLLGKLGSRTRALRAALDVFDGRYRAAQRRAGVLRFDDVPRLLRRGLSGEAGEDAASLVQRLYYRLDGALRHFLLDEFQDTSVTQFRALEPLLDEALHGAGEGRSVLCVGDVKQSLYAWRGASPEVLAALPARWPALGEPERPGLNFRSSPAVLACVNDVFLGLAGNAALTDEAKHDDGTSEAARRFAGQFVEHAAYHADRAGAAVLRAAPGAPSQTVDGRVVGPTRDERLAEVYEHAAERAKALRDAARAAGAEASVAVLVRKGKAVAPIVRALRALGVPAADERGVLLDRAPVVGAVLSLLQLAHHPGDSAALHHVRTSPLGALLGLPPAPAPGAWRGAGGARAERRAVLDIASGVRRRCARDGVAPSLRRLAARLAPLTDAHGVERLGRLIEAAEEHDAEGDGCLRAFIDRVRATSAPGAPGDVIVTTIHQSKGLEFDCVVLADLDGRWRGPEHTQVLLERTDARGRESALAEPTMALLCPSKALAALHPRLDALRRAARARAVTEELCCLYVAMTRARRVLEMIVPGPYARMGGLTPGQVLRTALGVGDDAYEPGALLWSTSAGDQGAGDGHVWAAQLAKEQRERAARAGAGSGATELGAGERAAGEAGATPAATSPATVQLRLAPARARALRARRESPSSREGGEAVRVHDLLRLGERAWLDLGQLVHAWMERVTWLDDAPAPTEADVVAVARRLGMSPDEAPRAARDALPLIRAALRGACGAALRRTRYAGRAGAVRVHNERAFDLFIDAPDGSGPPVRLGGRFDRLVVARDDAGPRGAGRALWAEVLDFKTDAVDAGDADALAQRTAHYAPQMQAYRAAAATLLALPAERVDCTLLFVRADTTVSVARA